MERDSTSMKSIRFVIDSDLENVPLVGMSVNRLCSLVPFPETEAYIMELCVVEAVNNSIIHAYHNQRGGEVETVFSLYPDRLVIQVFDSGTSMSESVVQRKDLPVSQADPTIIQDIPESGRGIGIIKSIMDYIDYSTDSGRNCLTMTKVINPGDE